MTNEYKSFLKTVNGNEGNKCHYNTRLDTYGRGCQHDCSYCYAKSLLDFRKMWDSKNPAVADIEKIKKAILKLNKNEVVRLGGMTDCFMPIEKTQKVTYETIKALNKSGIQYLIVTKSDLVAEDEYMNILDKNLAHIQITVTCFNDDVYKRLCYEKAPLPSKRVEAIEKLYENGFDVQLRLSPFIPTLVNPMELKEVQCDRILIEFLRVNSWVKKWFPFLDFKDYSVKQSGYNHLPLKEKRSYAEAVRFLGFEVSICEDESEAYEYWKQNFNPNPNDCCNLRKISC